MRVTDEPAFVLHHHDYRETSLLLEAFTRHHGRVGLVAKGVRRARSPLRAVLIPFQPLVIGFSGRGELATLTAAEPLAPAPAFSGESLYCGLYLNELLLRLLHRHDPHERLFRVYGETLARLAAAAPPEAALRIFEKRLLEEIGYGLVLDREVVGQAPLSADLAYRYLPERGPIVAVSADDDGIPISGHSLLALAREEFTDAAVLAEAKRLLRALLARQLGTKPLMSRQLFRADRPGDAIE
ncbi:MAG TPA: DNA repair protein RecO [Albitalea sp.]|nr:DNA repair protein RecO [Albitalea sp.]